MALSVCSNSTFLPFLLMRCKMKLKGRRYTVKHQKPKYKKGIHEFIRQGKNAVFQPIKCCYPVGEVTVLVLFQSGPTHFHLETPLKLWFRLTTPGLAVIPVTGNQSLLLQHWTICGRSSEMLFCSIYHQNSSPECPRHIKNTSVCGYKPLLSSKGLF